MDTRYDLSEGVPMTSYGDYDRLAEETRRAPNLMLARAARPGGMTQPLEVLLRRRELLDAEIARLEAQPVDEYGTGAVLIFDKHFGNMSRVYNYAAIKAGNGLWYLTGQETVGRTWESLLDFIHHKETQPVQVYWAVNAEPVFEI